MEKYMAPLLTHMLGAMRK